MTLEMYEILRKQGMPKEGLFVKIIGYKKSAANHGALGVKRDSLGKVVPVINFVNTYRQSLRVKIKVPGKEITDYHFHYSEVDLLESIYALEKIEPSNNSPVKMEYNIESYEKIFNTVMKE